MKKVLFVINTLGGAGAEKALLELLTRFSPEEYEVSLFVLMGQGELIQELPAHVKLLNQRYSTEPVLNKKGKKVLAGKVMARALSHASLFRNLPYLISNFLEMKKRKNVCVDKLLWKVMADGAWRTTEQYDLAVAYLEGGSAYYVRDYVNAEKKAVFLHVDYARAGYTRKLDRDCYPDFDRIFTVSGEVKDSFLQVYPECKEKTEIFHNLLDREKICKKALQEGGFSDGFTGTRLLTVGRLTAQKAYEVSIAAMKLLKEKKGNVRWYVLGEGNLRDKLQELIDQYGLTRDFILLGAKKNPYPYFAQTDIYVHASRFEGKSIAIQEAQILGCSIIVSDCSGNREQVEDGKDGLMCRLTPEDICDKIIRMMEDEELRMKCGRRAARKNFPGENDVEKLFCMMQSE